METVEPAFWPRAINSFTRLGHVAVCDCVTRSIAAQTLALNAKRAGQNSKGVVSGASKGNARSTLTGNTITGRGRGTIRVIRKHRQVTICAGITRIVAYLRLHLIKMQTIRSIARLCLQRAGFRSRRSAVGSARAKASRVVAGLKHDAGWYCVVHLTLMQSGFCVPFPNFSGAKLYLPQKR